MDGIPSVKVERTNRLAIRARSTSHDVRSREKILPALVDSTSPRLGEKVTYYSAVCLETGEVEAFALDGYSSTEASVTFLQQLRAKYSDPLVIFWDNSPAHGGDALRAHVATPDLRVWLVRLPAYSPDYNADEAIWDWARAEVTANTCLGTQSRRPRAGGCLLCQFAAAQRRGETSLSVDASGRGYGACCCVVFTWVSV
jgi:transposase